MFKNIIRDTPLTSSAANNFFNNITMYYNDGSQPDVSLISTLRAIVAPRMSESDRVFVQFSKTNHHGSAITQSGLTSSTLKTVLSNLLLSETGAFIIHNFYHSNKDDNATNMEFIKNTFTSTYPGYHRLNKITDFFIKSFPILCYINTDTKSVVIFVEKLDMKKLHYLQCAIPAMMPWYFTPENNVNQTEIALLQSLREGTSDKYEEYIAAVASQYDFKSARIRELLNGFETRYEKTELNRIKQAIQQTDNQINQYNDSIRHSLAQRNNFCSQLLGIELKIAKNNESGGSEIMDYFLCNKKLFLENVSGMEVYFSVGDYLSYYDKEIVEQMLNNKRSYAYLDDNGRAYKKVPPEKMGELFKAIFLDEVIRIRVCAAFSFSTNGVHPSRNHSYPSELRTYMPNQHIDTHGCMGDNSRIINELLKQGEYIGALEQTVSCAKSLNWADSTVMRAFMNTLYGESGYNNKCIELPDGSVVNPEQAIKWLESQSETNDTAPAETTTENETETGEE